jgi:hypothetical protein
MDSVPTWAKLAAWAVPLTVLPSATWRLVDAINGFLHGHPCAAPGNPLWEKIYVPFLSFGSIGLALLTVGLIRPWGEVFPRWLPAVGGRRVPVAFAVSAATTGAVLVSVFMIRGLFMDNEPLHPLPPGCVVPGWEVIRWYVPMVLWPPLLLAVTWHYWRRRTRRP